MDSYQIIHWMEQHGMDMTCPEFDFEVLARYSDPLRRQINEGLNILKLGK